MSSPQPGKCELPVDGNGDRVTLHYETFGARDGVPILLIQGLGTQCLMYEEKFCGVLVERGYYVIRFDNRDVGLSTKLAHHGVPSVLGGILRAMLPCCCCWRPTARYSLDDMGRDALGLLDHLSITRAVVLGCSMGGMIAQCIARMAPERLLGLVLVMTTPGAPGLPQADRKVRSALIAAPKEGEDEAARVRKMISALHGSLTRGEPVPEDLIHSLTPVAQEARRRQPMECSRKGFARQLRAIIAHGDRTPWLRQLDTAQYNVSVVHGASDPLTDIAHGRALADAVPGARFVALSGMGHTLPRQHWGALADEVQRCSVARGEPVGQQAPPTEKTALLDAAPM